MFESFFSKLSIWVEAFVNLIVDIINRVIRFFADVVNWFKEKLNCVRKRVAYIITMIELRQNLNKHGLGKLLDSPKVATVSVPGLYGEDQKFSEGIVQVVHDEENDKITDLRILGNDKGGIDSDLSNAMRGKNIIKLA